MTWLHDWSGLMVGWLLFAIVLAGSLAVFRPEIGNWARPEASCCVTDSAAASASAVRYLSTRAAGASSWYIRPADARSDTSYAFWIDPKAPGGYVQTWLDARTGRPDGIRDTIGGEFFYRLHFELQLPYPWGRLLSGSAAMVMLLALLTGIVAHRRFFADFFTFRPGKGQRSWLDMHNLLGVTALPFHLMITFTGALTLSTLLMPWGAYSAFKGDREALARAISPATIERAAAHRTAPLAPIAPMIEEAQRRFHGGLFDISIANPRDAAAVVTVSRAEDARIGIQAGVLSFDGTTGRLLAAHDEARPGVATYNVLYGLHTARFAQAALRWLYFLGGLMLTAMIGAGLLLWTSKRAARRRDFGFALVERLNLGFVGGTPIAFAAFFLANRLLPAELPGRSALEIRAVFWTWGALLLFALVRQPGKAWRDLNAVTAVACLAIPATDIAARGLRTDTTSLSVSLIAVLLAAIYALAMRVQRQPEPAPGLASEIVLAA